MKKNYASLTLLSALLFVLSFQARSQTYTFTCPTTTTTWTVPAGVTSVTVDVQGAAGGVAGPVGLIGATTVGKGGRTQATLTVIPGQVLNVYVGGLGATGTAVGTTGGFNGGGSTAGHFATYSGGGGGGASDIRIGGVGLANRVVVGGGGGGAGYDGTCTPGNQPGGDGGGLNGSNGVTCDVTLLLLGFFPVTDAGGGTQFAGGVGGFLGGGGYTAGSPGALGVGGNNNSGGGIGGGGGGGYYGGGGGCWMGGGGGSSYTDPILASAVTLSSGYNSGCGFVSITVNCIAGTILGTGTVCTGGTTLLSNATTGGTWSSSATGVATINALGLVTGVSAGTAVISYIMPAGCYATSVVTVTATPAILGSAYVCLGSSTTLTDPAGAGTWTSSVTGVGTIGFFSGIFSSVGVGTTNVTYTSGGGCTASRIVTVAPAPSPISGGTTVCVTGVLTLSDPIAGGTWSSSSGNATVDAFGNVVGVALGTSVITYATTASCYVTTTINVFNSPSAIIGPPTVCQGGTTNLLDLVAGGTWTSSNTAIATVGSSGSLTMVSGIIPGAVTITYSMGGSCYVTTPMTVVAQPAPITGILTVCSGSTIDLTDVVAGGGWISDLPGTASVDGVGVVTGGATLGTATITYTTGCAPDATVVVTVTGVPAPITGTLTVCQALTTSLTDATPGGTWSTTPGTGSVTVGTAGLVTGVSAGTATVSYNTGCATPVTVVVTVNPSPTPITGNVPVCVGLSATLNSTPAGGTWTTTPGTGSVGIGALTGVITGATAGTATVTYSFGGACYAVATVTVNPAPTAITGNTPVCIGLTTTLNSTPAGGIWSASAGSGSVGIGAGTGVITGGTAGNATVTYSFGSCSVTATVTVNANPTVITGNVPVCVGLTATLNSTPAGGTWSTTAGSGSVGIGAGTGIITGGTAGNATVTYTLGTGCIATATVTVNSNPTAITGNTPVCVGLTATLNSTPAGGIWSASAGTGSVGIGAGTGVITGGTAGNATVTYTLGTGCNVTATVTVNSNPTVITGNTPVCVGLTATLNSTPAGGVWSTSAGSGSVGIGAGTGIITGGTAGNATVTYTLGTGCVATATVTVNSNPTAITGNAPVCVGLTATLNSTPAGGIWSTSAGSGSVGIGAGTGIITGGTAGNATVTYTLGTGCNVTATVTVNSNPTAITGNTPVCVGLTTTLNSTPAGGAWSASAGSGSIAIDIVTGVVTGGTAGTATASYTLATGCAITTIVTVNTTPTAITGNAPVCAGLTITLNSTPAGGIWNTSAGSGSVGIGAGTGVVTGGTTGTATVTYALGSGCNVTAIVTVNTSPTAITGNTPVCVGLTMTLNSTPAGGVWSASAGSGSVGVGAGTGVVTGGTAGTANVTYSLGAGCTVTAIVTVNANPSTITGNVPVCVGLTATLNSTPAGGTWSTSAGSGSVGIGAGTGIITGGTAGNATVTYTLGTGCEVTATVTVNSNPTAITGNTPVCVGLTATLNSTPAGGTWTTSAGSGSMGIGAGTGIITGSTAGTATVTYTLGSGCAVTAIVTINANPTAITGNVPVCVGLTATLNSTPAGGIWSATAGSGSVGIGAGTGIITGGTAGNATVTYTLGTGCIATATVTVNSNPTAITGPTAVCVGLTATLNSTPAGGAWTSSNGNTSVGAGTGVITGNIVGTSTITYSLSTGCIATITVTVNSVPGAITGTRNVCVGAVTALTDAGGGTWTSSNGNASVDGSGNVTGLIPGTSTITYALGSGCISTVDVTVNANPTAITGNVPVCVGLTATLNSTPAGGTWSASAGSGSVGIGAGTGIITGGTAGNATVTYTSSTGCRITDIVTVNANPTAITGNSPVCVGLTTTLNSTPAGGTWSASAGTGSVGIGAGTGIVTGGTAGTATVTYTVGTGCTVTAIVTINALPTTITGNNPVCVGLTATLNSTPAGGTWTTTSGTGSVGIGAGTGIITGGTAGNATVTYTLSTGCVVTDIVTVNANPTAITGNTPVCVGLTTTLNSTPAGGTWSASAGTGSVGIGAGTGIVTGGTAGTATVTYTVGTGCAVTTIVTINALPTTITGNNPVCVGLTATLNSTPAGGTWSASAGTGSVGIGAGTGIITGGTAGNATVTYTLGTGCIVTATVTVNANPTAITGSTSICAGSTTTLNSIPAGGTWTSSNGNASAGAATGIITGNTVGTSIITYSLSTGCIATIVVTVNTVPSAITGTMSVCVGLTTTLNATPGGGTWTTTAATGSVGIGAGTGVVTGGTVGTATVTYSLGAGCSVSATVTVNGAPTAITGNIPVCVGLTATLNSTPAGGAWTTTAGTGSVGIGAGTGIITGGTTGTATVTYTAGGTGCYVTAIATVNANPTAITGNVPVCVGLTATLNSTPAGGIWSTSAGSGSVGIGAGTGIITGGTAGNATVTYTLGTGCIATAIVTVNGNPTAITGNAPVCVGATITLNATPAGGIWSASTGTGSVGIGAGTGIVTGSTAGTANVTYTLGTGCNVTGIVTINPLPLPIPGTLSVCVGSSVTLTDPTGGGVWSASNGNATIAGGFVTGVIAGTDVITYTLPATGCYVTAIETINPLPAGITGIQTVCTGLTTAFTDITPGGTWSSSATGTATVGATGIVTGGATAGTATITYTLATGCIATAIVTVNPLPVPITGNMTVCIGLTTVLTDLSGGGTWASSNGNATVVSGTVTGVTGGTSTITYTLPTGCITTTIVTVNTLPVPITGTMVLCSGATTTLSDTPTGGTWGSSATGTATIGSATGVVTGGATAGTATITYTIGTGCITTAVVTVNPVPVGITGTLSVCAGFTTALTDLTGGGTWSSSNPAAGTVSATGVVTGIATGTTVITYALPTGCNTTSVVTVNPLPSAITGTLSVCVGLTTALTDAGGGTWSSSMFVIASVSSTGVVTGGPLTGTSTITYTLPTGCIATAIVTVNPFLTVGPVVGTFTVCPSATTPLFNATSGGVWSSSLPGIATVGTSGVVTGVSAGTAVISYVVTNMCGSVNATAVITVNPLPYAGVITGTAIVCAGNTSLLTDAVPGGTWSSLSPTVASISPTGLLTGLTFGTATIAYQTTNICGSAFATIIATVNPAPSAGTILGSMVVCPGTSITLSDPSSGGGGVWSSGSPAIATIGSSSGIVTGVTTGSVVISYSVTNSCATASTTAIVTVHPAPTAILGVGIVCQGNSVTLTDSIADGTWSSSNATIATVVPVAGVFPTGSVTGVNTGTANISYIVAPGCFVTKTMTVTPLGAIVASNQLCAGETETATDLPGGGTWSTSTSSVASIDSITGLITAIASGAATITYVLSPGCITTTPVTVNGLPANFYVTGGGSYCSGGAGVHIGLDGSDTVTVYELYRGVTLVATDTGMGLPIDFGVYTVTGVYTVRGISKTSGCTSTMLGSAIVSITSPVAPTVAISTSPGTLVCAGSQVTVNALPTNGGTAPTFIWYVNGVSVGTGNTYTYTPNSGDVVGVELTSNASCIFPDTAVASQLITTTNGLMPSVSLSVSPGDSVCPGTPVTITPAAINGGTSPVYSWMRNGVYDGGGLTYTFMPTAGDNVFCWMHSSLSCSLADSVHSDNNISMNVPPINVPMLTITAIPGNRVLAGDTVTLIAGVSFSGLSLSYQWQINGIPVAGATTNTYTSSSFLNQDSVTCLVTGYSICGSATRSVSITIFDTLELGVNTMLRGADIRLIPNPNSGTFTVKGTMGGPIGQEVSLEVTDMLGQVVYKKKGLTHDGKLNELIQVGNTLANGMYILNLRSESEHMVFHFVVEQ